MEGQRITGAEIVATRHLLGLSQAEFADAIGVNRHAVKDWESGRFTARPGVATDILALRAQHDAEVDRLVAGAADGIPIELPDRPKPRGWYVALGARVLDRAPDAILHWCEQ